MSNKVKDHKKYILKILIKMIIQLSFKLKSLNILMQLIFIY